MEVDYKNVIDFNGELKTFKYFLMNYEYEWTRGV